MESHRNSAGDSGLDFFLDIFLDKEFDGGPIVVNEYRLRGRSDEWMRVEIEREREANHDFGLDVVERVRVTSPLAEADRPFTANLCDN